MDSDQLVTYNDWLILAADYARKETGQRLGQAFFNCLYDNRPDVGDAIFNTDYDPFYDDTILVRFLLKAEELW